MTRFIPAPLYTTYCWLRRRGLAVRDWNALAQRPEFRGATLAIVGNAGYLRELPQGEQIDAHNLVLRMNNFRLAGFERQVGRRMDIFLTTFHSDVNLNEPALAQAQLIVSSVPCNFQKSRRQGLQQRHGEFVVQGLGRLNRREAFAPGIEYFAAKRRLIGRYPTTGAMALFLAIDYLLPVCGEIFVTGFSFFEGTGHYFHDGAVAPANHDPAREQALLRDCLAPHVACGQIRLDARMQAQLGFARPVLR